jgi:hypothetical protein
VQLLFWLALAVLAGLVVFAATAVSLRSGATAAFGVGCGGALPVAFGLFAVFAATLLGQADLPGAESRTLRSVRLGFHVLGRRLGAAIGLVVLLFTAAIALGVAFTMADLGLAFALGASPSISISLRIALFLAQLLASSWLNLAFAGAFLALLRSERAIEAAATA